MIILVTGVSSSPGFATARELSREFTVVATYNEHGVDLPNVETIKIDLTKNPEDLVNKYRPDVLVHIAGVGNVDLCEENPGICYEVNAVATRRLMKAGYRIGSALYYLSTDYVFDGSRGLYGEEDVPRPINYYGMSKLMGEEAVKALDGSIVRVAWVYGTGPGRINFGRTVVDKLSKGEVVTAITDQYSSPTLSTIIGMAFLRLIKSRFTGIIHVVGPRMSRYEFAIAIAKHFGFNVNLVKPIRLADVNYKAPRPRDSSLRNNKAVEFLGMPLNDIDYALGLFERDLRGNA